MDGLGRICSFLAVSLVVLASLTLAVNKATGDMQDGNPLVTTDRESYIQGEPVGINVTCFIGMMFTTSKQCYFTVVDSYGIMVYNMSRHFYWAQVLTSLFPPKTFSFSWDQKNDTGAQVPLGDYEIWGYEAGYRMWDPPIAGNSTTIEIKDDTSPSQSVTRYEVSLVGGWNLFSLPLLASNYTSSSLGLPKGSVVVQWNSSTQSYDPFIVGVSPPLMAFAIKGFQAYFIYVSSALVIHLWGTMVTTPQTFSWTLPSSGFGWVLAGFPDSGILYHAHDVQSWIDNPGTKVVLVCRFNPTPIGIWVTWIPSLPGVNDFALIPGQGYAIYLSTSGGNVVTGTYP